MYEHKHNILNLMV